MVCPKCQQPHLYLDFDPAESRPVLSCLCGWIKPPAVLLDRLVPPGQRLRRHKHAERRYAAKHPDRHKLYYQRHGAEIRERRKLARRTRREAG